MFWIIAAKLWLQIGLNFIPIVAQVLPFGHKEWWDGPSREWVGPLECGPNFLNFQTNQKRLKRYKKSIQTTQTTERSDKWGNSRQMPTNWRKGERLET